MDTRRLLRCDGQENSSPFDAREKKMWVKHGETTVQIRLWSPFRPG